MLQRRSSRARHCPSTLDPDIEVACCTRAAMNGERIRADDEIANVSVDECAQQIDKSWFIGKLAAQTPKLLAQAPGIEHALRIGQLPPILDVVAVRFFGARVTPNGDAAFA
jgi:hypothetical protein